MWQLGFTFEELHDVGFKFGPTRCAGLLRCSGQPGLELTTAFAAAGCDSQSNPAEEAPIAKQPGQGSVKRRELSWWQKDRAGTPYFRHFSQQLAASDRWIVRRHAITAGDEKRSLCGENFADNSMNPKTSVTVVKNNFAGFDLRGSSGADGDYVSGPQGREHAGSRSAQLELSPGTQGLRRQTASAIVPFLSVHEVWSFAGTSVESSHPRGFRAGAEIFSADFTITHRTCPRKT